MKKLELVPEATVSIAKSLKTAPAVLSIADAPGNGSLTLRRPDGTKVEARMAAGLAQYRADNLLGRDVLVVFEKNDAGLPIAIELIHSPGGLADALTMDHDKDMPVEARVHYAVVHLHNHGVFMKLTDATTHQVVAAKQLKKETSRFRLSA